ncbi:hypothetical protein MHA_2740 [Mannheimia haemolytica PHL213]|nr:hypothetical protein MHA_2740 [Mannheimia haemolytica PHL213]
MEVYRSLNTKYQAVIFADSFAKSMAKMSACFC